MLKILILIAFSVIALVIAICRPALLAKNTFLMSFVSFELLNILAVILTITLASVANIHLWLNRIVRGIFQDNIEAGTKAASGVRSEINQDAWLLIWLFLLSCVVLFIKGSINAGLLGIALTHAVAMIILLANVLILCDIYSVIYKLIIADGKWNPATRPSASTGKAEEPRAPIDAEDEGGS